MALWAGSRLPLALRQAICPLRPRARGVTSSCVRRKQGNGHIYARQGWKESREEKHLQPLRGFEPSQQPLVALLESYHFAPHQINRLVDHLSGHSLSDKRHELGVVKNAIEFWVNNLKPAKELSTEQEEYRGLSENRFDFRKLDLNHVLAEVEPDLLLIKPSAMSSRMTKLKNIGFLSGSDDLWRVFVFAPRGYFLQDWFNFMQKYNFMQFRVMAWLLDQKRDKYPTPHPFVKYAKVFEQPYEHIKARFLFAVKTGLNAPSIVSKLDNKVKEVDLKILLLEDLQKYLQFVAPFCSEEEYLIFEEMVGETEDEDDKIIEELCELETGRGRTGNTSKRGIGFDSDSVTDRSRRGVE